MNNNLSLLLYHFFCIVASTIPKKFENSKRTAGKQPSTVFVGDCIKATPHKVRLTALHRICLHIFRHTKIP